MSQSFLLAALLASALAPAPEADSTAQIIDDVVVTGSRPATSLRLLPMSITTIPASALAAAHEPSLLPLLNERVPSLFATGRGVLGYGVASGAAGGIKIRGIGGSPTTGVLILIDGHPQYQGLMGHSLADVCQTVWAERVEVVRGPASVLYGSNALGGVVNIITRRATTEGWTFRGAAAYGSYHTATTSASVAVRRRRWSAVTAVAADRTDGHRRDMGFAQATAFVKATRTLPRGWTAMAVGTVTHFDASNPGPVSAPLLDNDSRITRATASATVERTGRRVEGRATAYVNWGRHHINDGHAPTAAAPDYRFHSRDHTAGLSAWVVAPTWRGGRATLGIEAMTLGGRAWNRYADGHRVTSADTSACAYAAYVTLDQRVGQRLTLDAGLRCDHHTAGATEWVPQAGATLLLPHAVELRLLASRGFRYPSLRELYMWQSANPALHAERLWSYEGSVEWHRADGSLDGRVGLFYIDADEIIETVSTAEGRPRNVNAGATRNAGVEVEWTWRPSAAFACATRYSYLHTSRPVLAAPRHKWNADARLRRGRWSVTADVLLVADLTTQLSPRRKENYWTMNLNADCRVSEVMTVFAKGENIFAQEYEINAGYPMPRATVTAGVNIKFH